MTRRMDSRSFVVAGIVALFLGIGICSSWAARVEAKRPSQEAVRTIVALELQSYHWQMCESDPELKTLARILSADIAPDLCFTWKASFGAYDSGDNEIVEGKPEGQQDDEIAQITRTGSEIWQELPDGSVRYITRVVAKESCGTCHMASPTEPTKPGEVIGYVSLMFTPPQAER